jgi:hypothetical protein
MTRAGKIILNVIVIAAAMAAVAAAVGSAIEVLSPLRVYTCDFRLISAATCDLPMAAHTIRAPMLPIEAEHFQRVTRRERITDCEHERTIQRRSSQPEPTWKCWEDSRR